MQLHDSATFSKNITSNKTRINTGNNFTVESFLSWSCRSNDEIRIDSLSLMGLDEKKYNLNENELDIEERLLWLWILCEE